MGEKYSPIDLWVVHKFNTSCVEEVFTSKEEAQLVCDKKIEDYYISKRGEYSRLSDEKYHNYFNLMIRMTLWKVISLYDAIEYCKMVAEQECDRTFF